MIQRLSNNMQVSINSHGLKELYIESSRIEECMKFAADQSIGRIVISSFHGYNEKDISFLKDFADQITGIHFLDDYYNLTILNSLKNLEKLGIPPKFSGKVDLSNLPNIRTLGFSWNPNKVIGLGSLPKLCSLTVSNYKGNDLTMEAFPVSSNLEELRFIKPTMVSLSGIGRFTTLKKLEIWSGRNLEDISPIKQLANSLGTLDLEKNKGIKDFNPLKYLNKCKELHLTDLGTIPSLNFITGMTSLSLLSFVGTTIEDGDLSYCEELEFVGFFDKKHYSHKSKDFPDKRTKMNKSGEMV